MSDGECQEGTTWESALFARQHNLKNLFVIIDDNKIQALGHTKDILDLTTAYEFMKNTLPNCEIVETIKGEGVSFMKDRADWHYRNLTELELVQALNENGY
jgi:transketolase